MAITPGTPIDNTVETHPQADAETNAAIVRTAIKAVGYEEQTLTAEQQEQARENIGSAAYDAGLDETGSLNIPAGGGIFFGAANGWLRSPDTDTLELGTCWCEQQATAAALTIGPGGLVGIGTSTPAENLEVAGNALIHGESNRMPNQTAGVDDGDAVMTLDLVRNRTPMRLSSTRIIPFELSGMSTTTPTGGATSSSMASGLCQFPINATATAGALTARHARLRADPFGMWSGAYVPVTPGLGFRVVAMFGNYEQGLRFGVLFGEYALHPVWNTMLRPGFYVQFKSDGSPRTMKCRIMARDGIDPAGSTVAGGWVSFGSSYAGTLEVYGFITAAGVRVVAWLWPYSTSGTPREYDYDTPDLVLDLPFTFGSTIANNVHLVHYLESTISVNSLLFVYELDELHNFTALNGFTPTP